MELNESQERYEIDRNIMSNLQLKMNLQQQEKELEEEERMKQLANMTHESGPPDQDLENSQEEIKFLHQALT
jgi:hypothetical protein